MFVCTLVLCLSIHLTVSSCSFVPVIIGTLACLCCLYVYYYCMKGLNLKKLWCCVGGQLEHENLVSNNLTRFTVRR